MHLTRFIAAFFVVFFFGVEALGETFAPTIDPNAQILNSARFGKQEEVLRVIDAGTSVNACSIYRGNVVVVALRANRLPLARELIQRGFDPTLMVRDQGGSLFQLGAEVLSAAVDAGAEEIVVDLLTHGARVFPSGTNSGASKDPVLLAVQANRSDLLGHLLKGADPESMAEAFRKSSSAYLAACRSKEILQILLDAGARADAFNPEDPFGNMLHCYAAHGWRDGVFMMIRLGVDPLERDRNGALPEERTTNPEIKGALQIAVVRAHVSRRAFVDGGRGTNNESFPLDVIATAVSRSEDEAIELLKPLPKERIDAADDRNWTLLNYAIHLERWKLAHALVERGADLAHLTARGQSVIAFASSGTDCELVRKMIARGASPNDGAPGAWNALLFATKERRREMVELLLANGAKVEPDRPWDSREPWRNVLMVAAETGDIPLAERILKAGADINALDAAGESVVFYGVRSGNVAMLHWLLEHGANAKITTPRGTNVATLAAYCGHKEMFEALETLGYTCENAREWALQGGKAEMWAFLNERLTRAKPDAPEVFWNKEDLTTAQVRAYIERGGDVNVGVGCPTPLQQMTRLGNVEAVALLLKNGAKPEKSGALRDPPVFLALHAPRNSLPLLQLFLDAGVSPNAAEFVDRPGPPERTPTGDTLLISAIRWRRLSAIRVLLERGADPTLRGVFSAMSPLEAVETARDFSEVERADLRQLIQEKIRSLGRHEDQDTPRLVKPAV